ncbi:MAG: HPr(Ser) kinase/phosphatase, partial [Elusimicrobia bacterium]|nr:HPr(Ser) kinase/phosphatase [Elusimicrobiota bacterium]
MGRISVRELIQRHGEDLQLEVIAGGRGLARKITVSEVNRPGLALVGSFQHFRGERVQIFGKGEHSYLDGLTPTQRKTIIERFKTVKILPCIIFTRGLTPPHEMKTFCDKKRIPLIKTHLDTAPFISELTVFLEDNLAPSMTVHGVLVDVFGLGVLILGDSGIGKSETALELVKRGHMLVADDVVEIEKRAGAMLVGRGQEIIKHHMEIRGLGIIDVRKIFGIGTILDRARIEMVVHLEKWEPQKTYDRLGIIDQTTTLLGVKVPSMNIPVYAGRNLATLIEVAALNQRLRKKGYNTARELDRHLIDVMASRK